MKNSPINRLSKYFNENEHQYYIDNVREYLTTLDTNITFFIVDKFKSTVDDLYGESKSYEIEIKNEITVPAIINLTAKENEAYVDGTGALFHEEEGNIEVTVLAQDLKDNDGAYLVNYGDYMGFQVSESKWAYYEVVDPSKLVGQNKMSHMGYRYVWQKFIGAPVEASQFNG